jgi:hypothetical protein
MRRASVAYTVVDLSAHFNNRAISGPRDLQEGGFNVWGNSFPADQLFPPDVPFETHGVPFVRSKPTPVGDNVRCSGQYVELRPVRCDWIRLVVAAERRAEAEVTLHFDSGAVDFEVLRVSDFWAEAPAAFGEGVVVSTTVMNYPHHVQPRVSAQLWEQRLPVTRRERLVGIRLPRHIAVHVFAMTVQGPAEPTAEKVLR